jgi:hypothetical protein
MRGNLALLKARFRKLPFMAAPQHRRLFGRRAERCDVMLLDSASPPHTWQEVYDTAQRRDGIVYQGAPYESLALNFLELAYASGGRVLSEDGRRSAIDSPENLRALELMVGGIKDGAAPAHVTEMKEEPAREEFSQGNATFMRNWPYAIVLMQQRSAVKDRFKAVELPAFEGGEQASVLVGRRRRRQEGEDPATPRSCSRTSSPRRTSRRSW